MLAVVIPTLNRYDLLVKCVASFRTHGPWYQTTVVDNGVKKGARAALSSVHAHRTSDILYDNHDGNMGVAASWNTGIQRLFANGVDWVMVSNDDIEVTCNEDLLGYERAMAAGAMCAVGEDGIGMSLFAVSRSCIEKVGFFDEEFWPAYFEDWDFHRRMVLAGLQQTGVKTGVKHHKSASTGGKHPMWQHNLNTFCAKWGYDPRTGVCRFTEPYDGRGSDADLGNPALR